jgi:hypothetical protein
LTDPDDHTALWDTLMFLRVMPQLLDPAPAELTDLLVRRRLAERPRGCVCCAKPAEVAIVADMSRPGWEEGRNFRWLDVCAACAWRIRVMER